MSKKKINRVIALTTVWVMMVQTVMAPVVLAEELVPETTEITVSEEQAGTEEEAGEQVQQIEEEAMEPEAEVTMETGDAAAEAGAVTQVNTTALDSEVEITQDNVGGSEDVAPFELTEEPLQGAGEEAVAEDEASASAAPATELELDITNQATVSAEASASAETGDNTQVVEGHGASAAMTTGDAVAVSSATALVNTTLINSLLQVGVVNVLSPWDGNLVLDPAQLAGGGEALFPAGVLKLQIDNSGNVTVVAESAASTGDNSQLTGGSAEMTTGQAIALSSTAAIVGLTAVQAEIIAILTQNLWLWNGLIYNFEFPGSVQTPQQVFGLGPNGAAGGCAGDCGNLDLTVENSADVEVIARANAMTGGNTQIASGSAELTTGNAYASATSTAIVNSTLINSRLSLLHLLLFAPWTGNLVFAYPDLVTTVSSPPTVTEGEDIPYTVTITNHGYKIAHGVSYEYGIVNDEHDVGEGGEEFTDLAPGESIVRTINFNSAGRAGHLVRLTATAAGSNTEVSESNNTAAAVTEVMAGPQEPSTGNAEGVSTEVPALYLASDNNALGGVYPGDGVSYDMLAQNNGPITAHNVVVVQEFYTPGGQKLTEMRGKVGELALSKQRTVRFVMTPSPNLLPGRYYTLSYLVGESDAGVETKSNVVQNEVPLIEQVLGELVPAADAQEPDQGAVLGAEEAPWSCRECTSFPWYIAVLLGTMAYYLVNRKRYDLWKVYKWGLALPLTGYAGLLLTSGDCRQGIMLVASASVWCKLFLPLSYGLYSSVGIINKLVKR